MSEPVLEYLKVLLTWPVAFVVVVVVLVLNFKKPISTWLQHLRVDYGGATLRSVQLLGEADQPEFPKQQVEPKDAPLKVEDSSIENLKGLINQWRVNAYLWEYRYLGFYLAYNTQRLLDWFYEHKTPVDLVVADSVWRMRVPKQEERAAMFSALKDHYLVQENDSRCWAITPKGKEYVEFRGPMSDLLGDKSRN